MVYNWNDIRLFYCFRIYVMHHILLQLKPYFLIYLLNTKSTPEHSVSFTPSIFLLWRLNFCLRLSSAGVAGMSCIPDRTLGF